MRPGKRFMAGPSGTRGQMTVSPDLLLNYEMVGNWKQANYMLRTFPGKVDQAINLAFRSFTSDYKKKIKSNIDNQGASIGWQPITSKRYLAFKEKHSQFDPSSHYRFFDVLYKSIKTYKTSAGWVVGIPKDARNDKMDALRGGNSLSVAEYAAVNEFGSKSRNIKARPLFYPSFTQLGGTPALTERVKQRIRSLFPSVKLRFPKGTKK